MKIIPIAGVKHLEMNKMKTAISRKRRSDALIKIHAMDLAYYILYKVQIRSRRIDT